MNMLEDKINNANLQGNYKYFRSFEFINDLYNWGKSLDELSFDVGFYLASDSEIELRRLAKLVHDTGPALNKIKEENA